MPLYEYQCTKCHRRTEKIEKVAGPHIKKCPHCGGKLEPMISAPAIQFKGSGWYVTDYAGKSGAAAEPGSKESKDKSGDAKDAASDSSKDGGKKETSVKETSSKESSGKESKEKKAGKKKD